MTVEEFQRQKVKSPLASVSSVGNGSHWVPLAYIKGARFTKKNIYNLSGRGAKKERASLSKKLTILLVISGLKMSAQDASAVGRGGV